MPLNVVATNYLSTFLSHSTNPPWWIRDNIKERGVSVTRDKVLHTIRSKREAAWRTASDPIRLNFDRLSRFVIREFPAHLSFTRNEDFSFSRDRGKSLGLFRIMLRKPRDSWREYIIARLPIRDKRRRRYRIVPAHYSSQHSYRETALLPHIVASPFSPRSHFLPCTRSRNNFNALPSFLLCPLFHFLPHCPLTHDYIMPMR